jgi:hypothetical protein
MISLSAPEYANMQYKGIPPELGEDEGGEMFSKFAVLATSVLRYFVTGNGLRRR